MKLLIKIVLIYFLTLFASNSGEILQNVSGKISEFASSVIPGEGLTEVNIEIKERRTRTRFYNFGSKRYL